MTQFRIKPYRATSWIVQRKWGPFWCSEYEDFGIADFLRTFETEAEAERYIHDELAIEARRADGRRKAHERQRTIGPRVYP